MKVAGGVIALACAVASGLATAQTTASSDEIKAARRTSNDALLHRDLKAFGASLDTDFVMVDGSGAFVPSRQAYLDAFAMDFADPKAVRYERIPDKVEISDAAPLASEQGHWIGQRPDGSKAYGGTYLAMWRKTASGWKLRSELFVLLNCYDAAACGRYRTP